MLRSVDAPELHGECTAKDQWRVSSGSAAVLGLHSLRMDTAPTTAYIMLGERCQRDCSFCAQARTSSADQAALSRVIWPLFQVGQVISALSQAHARGDIQRACFQVTTCPGHLSQAREAVALLARQTDVHICVSVLAHTAEDVRDLLQAGAQRVTLALDAATPETYARTKHGTWSRALELLETCARAFPGRVGTHLIVGLGESERDVLFLIQRLIDLDISIGLFAFTPVAGTVMATQPPPPLDQYRRVQAALWLVTQGHTHVQCMTFDAQGQISGFGLPSAQMWALLSGGQAFQTPGCPGCNRPYYNERPGGVMYNYPRPLTLAEVEEALELLFDR
jgi:biotin synthase